MSLTIFSTDFTDYWNFLLSEINARKDQNMPMSLTTDCCWSNKKTARRDMPLGTSCCSCCQCLRWLLMLLTGGGAGGKFASLLWWLWLLLLLLPLSLLEFWLLTSAEETPIPVPALRPTLAQPWKRWRERECWWSSLHYWPVQIEIKGSVYQTRLY